MARYPEKEFISAPAARTYCEPARPFLREDRQPSALTAQQANDEVLDADDVLFGKRIVLDAAQAATSLSARRTPSPPSKS